MMTFLGMSSANAAETSPVTTTDNTAAVAAESPDISKVESTASNAIEQYENGSVSSVPANTELGPVQISPKEEVATTSVSQTTDVTTPDDTTVSDDATTVSEQTSDDPVQVGAETLPDQEDPVVADNTETLQGTASPVVPVAGDSAGDETAVMDRDTDYTATDSTADLAVPVTETPEDPEAVVAPEAPVDNVTETQPTKTESPDKQEAQKPADTDPAKTTPSTSPSKSADTPVDTDKEAAPSKFKLASDKVTSGSDVSGFLEQKLPEGSTVWITDKNGNERRATVSSDGRSFTYNGTLDPGNYTVEVRGEDGKSSGSSKLNVTEKVDEDLSFNPTIKTPLVSESGDVITVEGSGYNGYKTVKITYFDPATNKTTERVVAVDENGNFVDDKYGLAYSPDDRVVVIVTAVDKDGKVTTESKEMNVSAPGRPNVDLNLATKAGDYYQVTGNKFVPNETYKITVTFADGSTRNYTITPDESKSIKGSLDTTGWPTGLATVRWSNESGYRVPLDQLITVLSESSPIDPNPGDPGNPPVNPIDPDPGNPGDPVDPDPDPGNPTPIPDPENPDPVDPVVPLPPDPGNPGNPDPGKPGPVDPDPGNPDNPEPNPGNPGNPGDPGDGDNPTPNPNPGDSDGPIQVDPVVNIDPDRGDGNGNGNDSDNGTPGTDPVSDQSPRQEEQSGGLLSDIIDTLTNRKHEPEVNDTARLEPDAVATPEVGRLNALAGRDNEDSATPLVASQQDGDLLAGPSEVDRLNQRSDSGDSKKEPGEARGDKKMDSFTFGSEEASEQPGSNQASEASDTNNDMQIAVGALGGILGLSALGGLLWWILAKRRRDGEDEQGRHVA